MGPNLSFEFRTLRRAPAMLGFIIAMALLFLAPNLPRLHPVVGYEQEVQSYMGDASQISAQLEAWRKNPPATAPTNPSVRELRAVQTKLTAVIAAETATPVQVRTVMRAKLAYGQLLVRGAARGGRSSRAPRLSSWRGSKRCATSSATTLPRFRRGARSYQDCTS